MIPGLLALLDEQDSSFNTTFSLDYDLVSFTPHIHVTYFVTMLGEMFVLAALPVMCVLDRPTD